jgi:hypothetical protein
MSSAASFLVADSSVDCLGERYDHFSHKLKLSGHDDIGFASWESTDFDAFASRSVVAGHSDSATHPVESAYTSVVDWQGYEREIVQQFRTNYPGAEITPNAKLVGKFSKVERQIDLLIEERASDFAFRVVIDAKYRGRKIDVGDVEAFIGLTRDVEAHTGMIVALAGY